MQMPFSRKLLMPVLLAVAIASISLTALAGQHGESYGKQGHPHAHHQQMRQSFYERAGIDEATREALEQAHEEHHQALEDLHREHRERMDELLDDEQQAALEAARRDMRDEWRKERHAAMQERFESIVDGWDLSEEDREALRKTREALYADMQALREQDFETREERREAWHTVRNSHYEALSELLGDEQIAELKEAAQSNGGKWHGHRGDGKQGKHAKHHGQGQNQNQGNDDTNGDTD